MNFSSILPICLVPLVLLACDQGLGGLDDAAPLEADSTEAMPSEEMPIAEDPPEAFPLLADTAGFVSETSNPLGIQGRWSTRVGLDSTIEIRIDGPDVCFSGEASLTPPGADGADYFGSVASLALCAPEVDTEPPHTLGSCPWSPELAQRLKGVGFTVDGTLPGVLRVGFPEEARLDTPYVVVRELGEVVALVEDALVRNDSAAELPHPAEIQALEFRIPSSRQAARPFDICVKDLAALTGGGWRSKEIPEWVYVSGLGQRVDLVGVNLAGAEFGMQNLPGTYETDYVYPGPADFDMFAERGMNVVRLPFRWERLQQGLGLELDATELERLTSVVEYATDIGLKLILDPHNFARYTTAGVESIVGVDIDVADFADFWRRVAELFGPNPDVIFGLVNEPHDMPTEAWLAAANAAIAAIRETGAANLILVPGNGWSGAHNWTAAYYGTSNSVAMAGVVDPGNNFAFDIHQYLDADSSGTGSVCVSETIGVERMLATTTWMRDHGYRAMLAEFNGPGNSLCLRAIDNLLNYVADNSDVWLGWAVWAGGPRWGDNQLSVQLLPNGKERPQLVVLKRHLLDGLVTLATP